MSIFSECLNQIRENHRLKIVDLAQLCEFDTSVVYRWCYGERTPSSYNIIDILAEKMSLTILEKKQLEESYMETIWGMEEYKNHHIIEDLLKFLYEEYSNHYSPLKSSKKDSKVLLQNLDTSAPYFRLLDNHLSIIREVFNILHHIDPSQTIYIKLHEPFDEFLFMLLHHIFIFSPQKMEILLCVSNNTLNQSIKMSYLKTISEIFVYNTDAKIMIMDEYSPEMYDHINWIMVDHYCLQFNRVLQNGSITNYPEWLQNIMFHFNHLKENASILGDNVDDLSQQKSPYTVKNRIDYLGFLPQLADFSYQADIICTVDNIREFIKKGRMSMTTPSIKQPLSVEECKLILKKMLNQNEDYHLNFYLLKNYDLPSHVLLELWENTEKDQAKIQFLEKDGKVHGIHYYNKEILACFSSYFRVIKHPRYCFSPEESRKIINDFLDDMDIE